MKKKKKVAFNEASYKHNEVVSINTHTRMHTHFFFLKHILSWLLLWFERHRKKAVESFYSVTHNEAVKSEFQQQWLSLLMFLLNR